MRAAPLIAILGLAACSSADVAPPVSRPDVGFASPDGGGMLAAMPDFELVDLSSSSSTSGQRVSPRDHLGHISGWYFTHAT